MFFQRAKARFVAAFLALLTGLFYSGVSHALVISTNTTWTDPAALNDSLIINPGVTLRILNSNGVDGGDLLINLPNGGIFQVQNGGILNLNGVGVNGNAGNLTVLLTGPAGNIDIAGVIVAQGLGTGTGGVITLNGSSFNLASTGAIFANSQLGSGGRVTMNNATGLITVNNGFDIQTSGFSDATHNLIEITGVGVNVSGILNANGTTFGSGTSGGRIVINATGGSSDVNINNNLLASGTLGQSGGMISVTAGRDVNLNGGAALSAASGSGGSNLGNGGTVTLDGGRHVTITSTNGSYSINVNAAESPVTTAGNGVGGNVYLSAGTGDITISQSTAGSRAVIEANGASGGLGAGGLIEFTEANNVIITNSGPKRFTLLARGGNDGGNGGTIRIGGDGAGEDITGNISIDDSILWTLSGDVNTSGTGHGGEIDIELDGTFNATNATIQSLGAGGAGNGGTMTLAAGGDVNFNDANSNFLLWSNGSGTVNVSGVNINNSGIIGSRAARTSTGPAANANNGGILNVTATGSLINDGELNASAWTPRLDYIPTNEESTGAGGNIVISANAMINNGDVHAYGGLNTQGASQGQGGNIDINVTNGFLNSATGTIDSRGTPFQQTLATGRNRIDIDAGSIDSSGAIRSPGFYANNPGGYIELTSTTGDINLNAGSTTTAAGGIGDLFNNQGSGGEIQLASAGNILVAGDLHARGQTSYAGGDITATAAGTIQLLNGGSIDSSGNVGTGDVTLTSTGGTITLLDDVTAGGDINMSAVLGSITLDSVSQSTTHSGQNVSLTAPTITINNALTVVEATGDSSSSDLIFTDGDIVTGGTYTATAGGTVGVINVDGDFSSAGTLRAWGTGGDLLITYSGGDLDLTNVTLNSGVGAAGNINIVNDTSGAGNNGTIDTVDGSGTCCSGSTGEIIISVLNGYDVIGNNVTFNAPDVRIAGTGDVNMTNVDMDLGARNYATVTGDYYWTGESGVNDPMIATAFNIGGNLHVDTGDIDVEGNMTVGGDVYLRAEEIDLNSAVIANGNTVTLAYNGGNSVTVGGTTNDGNLNITTTELNRISADNVIIDAENDAISINGDIDVAGSGWGAFNLTMQNTGGNDITATNRYIRGGNHEVNLIAGDDVNISNSGAGDSVDIHDITAGDELWLATNCNGCTINLSGDVNVAGAQGSYIRTSGANSGITLAAGSDVTINNTDGSFEIETTGAASDINLDGTLVINKAAGNGTDTFFDTTDGDITINGDVTYNGNGNGDELTIQTFGNDDSITVGAGASLTSSTDLELETDGDNADIIVNSTATITVGDDLDIDTDGNDSDIIINDATINIDGDIDIRTRAVNSDITILAPTNPWLWGTESSGGSAGTFQIRTNAANSDVSVNIGTLTVHNGSDLQIWTDSGSSDVDYWGGGFTFLGGGSLSVWAGGTVTSH